MDAAMIKGITVTLYTKEKAGVDGFNRNIYTETPVAIENVIVSPVTSEDIIDEIQLSGKHIVYELCIPKGDTHEWTNCKVEFYDAEWRTVGIPTQLIESNVPLLWNKKIKVERYEG